MRFEYKKTIKEQIEEEHDKAFKHGREIDCVWLTEFEWDSFVASLDGDAMMKQSAFRKKPQGAYGKGSNVAGMWDGVVIKVCPGRDSA